MRFVSCPYFHPSFHHCLPSFVALRMGATPSSSDTFFVAQLHQARRTNHGRARPYRRFTLLLRRKFRHALHDRHQHLADCLFMSSFYDVCHGACLSRRTFHPDSDMRFTSSMFGHGCRRAQRPFCAASFTLGRHTCLFGLYKLGFLLLTHQASGTSLLHLIYYEKGFLLWHCDLSPLLPDSTRPSPDEHSAPCRCHGQSTISQLRGIIAVFHRLEPSHQKARPSGDHQLGVLQPHHHHHFRMVAAPRAHHNLFLSRHGVDYHRNVSRSQHPIRLIQQIHCMNA